MADNKVTVEFEVVSNAAKKLDDISNSLESLQDTAEGGFKKASSSFKVFEGVLTAELALRAIDALAGAARSLFNTFVVEGVKAALETEAAVNKLSFALAQSGRFSQEAVSNFEAFADAIENTTTVSAEAAIEAGALIAQISGLGGQDLQQATQAAIDLSAALGIDLEGAARKVALATNGQTDGLKKFGIEIVKTSDESQQFAAVLDGLQRVQGAGANRAKTFEGAIQQLENRFSDITKIFGEAIVQNQAIVEVFNEATKILGEFTDQASGNKEGLKSLVSEGVVLTIDGLIRLVSALGAVAAGFEALKGVLLAPFNAVAAAAASAALAVQGNFKAALEALKQPVVELNKDLQATGSAEIFNPAIDALGRLRQAALEGQAAVSSGQEKTATSLVNATQRTRELTAEQEKLIKALQDKNAAQENLDIEGQLARELEAIKAAEDLKTLTRKEANDLRFTADLEAYDKEVAANDQRAELILARNDFLRQEDLFNQDEANAEAIAENERTLNALLESRKVSSQLQQRLDQADLNNRIRIEQERRQVLNNAVQFQSSKIKEVAALGKAAAIFQITISTKEAAIQAFKSLVGIPLVGPVLAPIAAGAAIAFGAEQIAGVLGAQLAGGIDSVPGVGTRDNFPAVLAPGERVVPAKSNQDLTAFLEGRGQDTALLQAIVNRLDRLQNQVIVNVGSREIVNELRDSVLSGRTIEAA